MSTKQHVMIRRLQNGVVAAAFALILLTPSITIAQETTTPTTETGQVATTSEPVVQAPANYVFNEVTGLWENGTYSWDPATNKSAPLNATAYSYNPDTEAWDSEAWRYDGTSGSYVPNTKTAVIENTGPNSTNTIKDPVTDSAITNTGPSSTNATNGGTINNTGPNSNNSVDRDDDASQYYSSFYNVSISGTINSSARSGDASVMYNTFGGNATTGDAMTQAMILNMLQSSWGAGISPALYSATIQGGHIGDLMIDPQGLAVAPVKPTGASLEVVVAENVSIDNEINLEATSGNATVSGNTTGGNATTGDAQALVTLMNLINSSITSGQSFIGVLNILGDLEGDVLIPENVAKQLLAANVPTTQISLGGAPAKLNIDNTSDTSIKNDINATASSGQAVVTNNTVGGSASSGNAETNVTVFNLTGQQVVAENALLVFVNVMGEWVGFITNAPKGATAALLGYGTTTNVPYDDVSYDVNRNYTINNDVDVSSTTGDATVSKNTFGGDATTGSASSAVNILNVANSNLSLSNWFGALFINIFGNWHGSFGTDTAYGGMANNSAIGGDEPVKSTTGKSQSTSKTENISPVQEVIVLAPSSDGQYRRVVSASGSFAPKDNTPPPTATVLAESVEAAASEATPTATTSLENNSSTAWISWIVIALVVGAIAFGTKSRFDTIRSSRVSSV